MAIHKADQEFKNKNYLLIGAANGVGKTLACDLAQAQANLFLVDSDKKLSSFCKSLSKKTKCKEYLCDLTHYEKVVSRSISMIGKENFDGIVYLVRGRQKYSYAEMDEKKWDTDFRLSVGSLTHIVQQLWAKKKINEHASIVLISSVCSKFSGSESLSYHMAKSALESMCRYLASEMGPSRVRINTLQLGLIVKDEHKERFYSKDNDEYRFWAQQIHPLRRVGHNTDVVGPIKFFLSGASSFITGQVLCVDGGLTIQEPAFLVWNFMQAKKRVTHAKR